MWKVLFLALSLLLPGPALAEVYRWVAPDGTVHYSDEPREEGAERVELPPLSTVEPRTGRVELRPSAPRLAQAEEGDESPGYRSFTFANPSPDEAIRANNGRIQVVMKLEPMLHAGHRIRVSMDGEPLKEGTTALSFPVPNVARGTHTLSAEVLDNRGETQVTAPAVTFHVLRVALGGAKTAP